MLKPVGKVNGENNIANARVSQAMCEELRSSRWTKAAEAGRGAAWDDILLRLIPGRC